MSHAHHPPELAEVTDEAGNTPSWVPLLGVALFALMVVYIWWAHSQASTLPRAGTPEAQAPSAPAD
ncbi:MAG: hypothetical protein JWN48_828 [Myxococcaceae bacterium]|nr:hypothetical protein [Myxococcaceae bacterium]